jgi:hypothetical protein
MPSEYIPPNYATLHEALARVGEATVDGWDGSEASQYTVKSEVDLSAPGITWVDREYDERLWSVSLPRLCPPTDEGAARLAQAVGQIREWAAAGLLQLWFLADDVYQAVPLRAVLRDDAVTLTGRYGGYLATEAVVVLQAELDAALAETLSHGRTVKAVPEQSTSTDLRPLDKKDIEALYVARANELTAKGERSSEKADLAFLRNHSPGIPRERMREIRRRHAPSAWTKGGAPGYK